MKIKYYFAQKLATTTDTVIKLSEEQILVDWENVEQKSEAKRMTKTTISGAEIFKNDKINIYPLCANKSCKVKVISLPGENLLSARNVVERCYSKSGVVGFIVNFRLKKMTSSMT